MLRYHRVVSCTQDTMMTHNNILERHDYTCVSIEYDLLEIEKVEKGLTLQIVCVCVLPCLGYYNLCSTNSFSGQETTWIILYFKLV